MAKGKPQPPATIRDALRVVDDYIAARKSQISVHEYGLLAEYRRAVELYGPPISGPLIPESTPKPRRLHPSLSRYRRLRYAIRFLLEDKLRIVNRYISNVSAKVDSLWGMPASDYETRLMAGQTKRSRYEMDPFSRVCRELVTLAEQSIDDVWLAYAIQTVLNGPVPSGRASSTVPDDGSMSFAEDLRLREQSCKNAEKTLKEVLRGAGDTEEKCKKFRDYERLARSYLHHRFLTPANTLRKQLISEIDELPLRHHRAKISAGEEAATSLLNGFNRKLSEAVLVLLGQSKVSPAEPQRTKKQAGPGRKRDKRVKRRRQLIVNIYLKNRNKPRADIFEEFITRHGNEFPEVNSVEVVHDAIKWHRNRSRLREDPSVDPTLAKEFADLPSDTIVCIETVSRD